MVEYDFGGKVALVTGAARGQGRSHVLRYAEHGADVVAVDVGSGESGTATDEQLARTVALAEDRGARAVGVEADVSEEADVERAVRRATEEFGRVDVLANNAGVAPVSGLLDLEEATWDRTLDVDLKGTWLCSKHAGRQMVEQGDGGRIVNTASVAGLLASPGLGHYSAAKHGVVGLTKNLAIELSPHDVTVNAVCPTAVDTAMTAEIVDAMDDDLADLAAYTQPDNVLGDVLQPEDVTAAFMWLSSEEARYVTGIALPVAAGATAV